MLTPTIVGGLKPLFQARKDVRARLRLHLQMQNSWVRADLEVNGIEEVLVKGQDQHVASDGFITYAWVLDRGEADLLDLPSVVAFQPSDITTQFDREVLIA